MYLSSQVLARVDGGISVMQEGLVIQIHDLYFAGGCCEKRRKELHCRGEHSSLLLV